MGIERVIDLLTGAGKLPAATAPDVYVVVNGQAVTAALALVETLREALPSRRIELNLGGGKFKSQFSRADQSGARLALIVGDDELARGVVALKPLRREAGQSDCPVAELASQVEAALSEA
jgi:histidyl-tRNA synthetase